MVNPFYIQYVHLRQTHLHVALFSLIYSPPRVRRAERSF